MYQRHYANAERNSLVQDASLGRSTESSYLDILNYMGTQYDENAPSGVSDDMMRAIGTDARVRKLMEDWAALEAELQTKYGKSMKATSSDKKRRDQKQNELRVARQTQRRKVAAILGRKYFKEKNDEELDRQLCGIHEPQQPLRKIVFRLSEQRLIADILSDSDEDLPEDEIVRRKVDATNALVSYAWKIEPREEELVRSIRQECRHRQQRLKSDPRSSSAQSRQTRTAPEEGGARTILLQSQGLLSSAEFTPDCREQGSSLRLHSRNRATGLSRLASCRRRGRVGPTMV